jgi:hypothetical protein
MASCASRRVWGKCGRSLEEGGRSRDASARSRAVRRTLELGSDVLVW